MATHWWQRGIGTATIDNVELKRKKLVLYTMSYLGSFVIFLFALLAKDDESTLVNLLLAGGGLFCQRYCIPLSSLFGAFLLSCL